MSFAEKEENSPQTLSMVLSSNWLALQKDGQVPRSRTQPERARKAHGKVKKPRVKRNGSKIMDMVYNMNKEIALVKQARREGRSVEFKSESFGAENEELLARLAGNAASSRTTSMGKYVAMDCEFVGVGSDGKDSMLARISIVNYYGHVVMDEYVRPTEEVTDWRTWVSGIKPEHMKNAISFKEAQARAAEILKGRILVGHSLKHDLESLLIAHPKSMIRDTSRHLPYRQEFAKGKIPSLKKLAKEVLKIDIQDGKHSSIVDARAAMLLYKEKKQEFEELHKVTYSKKPSS